MKPQNNAMTRILRKIIMLIFLDVFLFACTTPAEPAQSPITKPTKNTNPPTAIAPNTPQKVTPTEVFSIQDADKLAPDDVLKEISYSPTGGGFDCDWTKTYTEPTLEYAPTKVEWLDYFGILICGWQADEAVSLTILDPNGNIANETFQAAYDEIIGTADTSYYHTPSENDQTGTYSYIFEGESGKISLSVNIYVPLEPRLYPLYEEDIFFLYGYYPNERVRFLLYNSPSNELFSASLTAWNEYYVDENGQLIIKTKSGFGGYYFAIGDQSGVNRNSDYESLAVNTSPSSNAKSCNSNLPSRVETGKYAYVATDPPLDQRIREGAGTSYSISGYIAPGNSMKILEGPICADGWAWWKVQSIKKPELIGWTSEGDDVYWLIPCNSLNSCP